MDAGNLLAICFNRARLVSLLLFKNSKDEKIVEKMIYGAELGNLQWLKHWEINFQKNLRDMLVPSYLYSVLTRPQILMPVCQ